jgi:hypothetical protein
MDPAVAAADEPDDEGASPRAAFLIVPAVVAKPTRTTWLPPQAVATMASALTAAALSRCSYPPTRRQSS